MMKNLLVSLFAFASLGLSACGSQCDTLRSSCDACKNATGKLACTTVVSAGNQDACKAANESKVYAADSTVCK